MPALNHPTRHATFLALAGFAFLALIGIANAIKTDRVELGREGVYDAQVYVERDTSGTLVFRDTENTAPLSLSDLASGGVATHADLNGLNADDHAQYLTTTRHAQTHSQAFNGLLAIPPDGDGNTSLGSHVSDSDIHLDRRGAVEITGDWRFVGAPRLTSASIGGVAFNLADPWPLAGDVLEYVGNERAEWRTPQASLSISGEDGQVVRADGADGIQGSGWRIDDAGTMSGDTVRALAYEPSSTTAPLLFRARGSEQGCEWQSATSGTLMALDASGNMTLAGDLSVSGYAHATSLTLGNASQGSVLRIAEAASDGTLLDVREAVSSGFSGKVLAISDSSAHYITAAGVFGGATGQFVTLQGNYILGRYSNTDMHFRQGNANRRYRFQDQTNTDIFVVDLEGGLYATSLSLTTAIALSGGAYSDGADWLTGSTRGSKTDIRAFDPAIAWERLDAIAVKTFRYKQRNPRFGQWVDPHGDIVRSTERLAVLNAPSTDTARAAAIAAGYRRDSRARLEQSEAQPRLGFIAEDLQEIDEGLAPGGRGVSATAVAAHNTAALKEAKSRIGEMEAQIDALREEARFSRLRTNALETVLTRLERHARRREVASP